MQPIGRTVMAGSSKIRIRAIVGPNVLQSALRRVSDRLAVWHNHPLTTRRYMWKTEY